MKEYLYFDTIFKTHLIASSELGDRYTLIGEVSEILTAYLNRGKSPYNNAVTTNKVKLNPISGQFKLVGFGKILAKGSLKDCHLFLKDTGLKIGKDVAITKLKWKQQ